VGGDEEGIVMTKPIKVFRGRYAFLSNIEPCKVILDGIEYTSVQHAYQAAKTFDIRERQVIEFTFDPREAKCLGKKVKLREDWEAVKEQIMLDLLRQKFRNRTRLRNLLLETGDAHLEEGNRHGDKFWGTVNGEGKNMLGIFLMQVRKELRDEDMCQG
jgi:ribA/ribD-fused uncharacterized protein